MKKILFSLLVLVITAYNLFPKDGDTIKVRTIDFNTPKYGWFDFPDASKSFQKILMNYTIKCPCGEWDYLAMVFIKQFFAPSFRVDSSVVPQFSCMFDTSWNYTAKVIGGQLVVDSTPKKPRLLEFYSDSSQPTVRTSFRYVWDTYYRYTFDKNGNPIDSVLVPPDTTLYLQKRRIYFQDPIAIEERYEIMRFVTPYGIGLDVGDGFTWTMDVTDFAPLLTGKVYIDAPNQQEPIQITFDFIEGIPERDILRLERIYDFVDVVYNKDFEKKIDKIQVNISPLERMFKLKVIQTGHGFGGNEDNCCEFCKKNAYVKVNDTVRYTREVWRICSENPLFPQGGTWLFNRTNWCPGAEVQPFDFELTPFIGKNRSFTFDYDMDYYDKPYSSGSNTIGRWIITAYIITYSNLKFNLDAEIQDIIAPSNKDIYSRLNPTSTHPIILVRNRGSETITKLKFKYGIVNSNEYTYVWNGEIPSLSSQQIILPSIDCKDWQSGSRKFKVEILEVNGQSDEYPSNNIGYSDFALPPSFYKNLAIKLTTNNYNVLSSEPNIRPYSYVLKNSKDDVIIEKNDFLPSSTYIDSIYLEDGCYEFSFFNEFECGLGFWFYQRNFGLNNGLLQINSDNLTLYQPNVDFGKSLHFFFYTEDQPAVQYSPDTLLFGDESLNQTTTCKAIIKPKNLKGISVWNFDLVLGESKGFAITKFEPPANQSGKWDLSFGDSLVVYITLTPKKAGKVSTSLTFYTNDKKNPVVTIPVRANVVSENFVQNESDNLFVELAKSNNNVFEFNIDGSAFANTTISIYNILGKLLKMEKLNYANGRVEIDLKSYDSGCYWILFQNGKTHIAFPVLVIKE